VEAIELQTAKGKTRLTLSPVKVEADVTLPPKFRVSADNKDVPAPLNVGDHVTLRARLVPPPAAAVPGGYDFARVAWFKGLGAAGSAMGKITRIGPPATVQSSLRDRLSAHVRAQIEGSAGGIATAFVTGDEGGISEEDQNAMRRSGLAHLLSISGLHVTAVIAAAMFLTLRLLALFPALALRWNLLLASAGMGALAGIGYTLLTGSQVPTVRSCVAAMLVIAGVAMGREAVTLRLVAMGALVILLFLPEALIGPSFQLSFAAIVGLIAWNDVPVMRRFNAPREESRVRKLGRNLVSLVLTGLAVEIVLAPIGLYHFQRSGLYGALANIIAIPLTTFVVMPLEALALLFDTVGAGMPFWWLTGLSLKFLVWLAHSVSEWPGAIAAVPSVPIVAFALMIGGGCWLLLWATRLRLWGLLPLALGALWTQLTPAPDILITNDGRHMVVRGDDGRLAVLRPRAGDYVRSMLAQRSGTVDELDDLDDLPGATCSLDLCTVNLRRGERSWRILATRSNYRLPWVAFTQACASADIVISDRRLPKGCTPRWFKADRWMLGRTGGLAVTLGAQTVETVRTSGDQHPWLAMTPFNHPPSAWVTAGPGGWRGTRRQYPHQSVRAENAAGMPPQPPSHR
jgi:competence protein ComEC